MSLAIASRSSGGASSGSHVASSAGSNSKTGTRPPALHDGHFAVATDAEATRSAKAAAVRDGAHFIPVSTGHFLLDLRAFQPAVQEM
jgi:hypothetical protein